KHLLGPRDLARHIAEFPAAHFGGTLSFRQKVGDPLDLRHVDAAADRPHRIAAGIALNQAALEDGTIAPPNVSNAIRGSPPSAAEQAQHGRFSVRLEIARMDPLLPRLGSG